MFTYKETEAQGGTVSQTRPHRKSETRLLIGLFFQEHVHIWSFALFRSAQEGEEGQGQDKDSRVWETEA